MKRYLVPWMWSFSDECHFAVGPEERVRVIRRPGEYPCPNFINEKPSLRITSRLLSTYLGRCWMGLQTSSSVLRL